VAYDGQCVWLRVQTIINKYEQEALTSHLMETGTAVSWGTSSVGEAGTLGA
jgi:hypothetical protein